MTDSIIHSNLSSDLALITGCTGGIGRATALTLARAGCSIAVHYHQASDTSASLVSELQSLGVRAAAFQADVADYESVRTLHAAVVEELGHPSILFNNAGTTLGKHGVTDVKDVSVEEFERCWRSNTGGAYLLTQLCMPAMEERGWGRIVFCSSVAAFTGGVVGPHYA